MDAHTSHPRLHILTALLPIVALLAAMGSIQFGAATAQQLFPIVGAQGATALRVSLAAILLLAIRRPSIKGLTAARIRVIALYGASLGAMNLLFYLALRTIPLGVAVAVEFVGPLAVAAASHRSKLDILWLVLAAAGLIALAPFAGGPHLDPEGLLLVLGAAFFWALYILFGRKAGEAGPGVATALGMAVAALVVAPFGLAHAGLRLFSPALLPLALAVAVLSSALPYSLEMVALTRLPKATFGALMSVEPAVAALFGWLMLGQRLNLRQELAIACIIAASAGATVTLVADHRRSALAEAAPP
jgi:inner membrane transporter RhtA